MISRMQQHPSQLGKLLSIGMEFAAFPAVQHAGSGTNPTVITVPDGGGLLQQVTSPQAIFYFSDIAGGIRILAQAEI
jgi:hypothetical protein